MLYSETATAINQLLQLSEDDQESMMEVIGDFFDLSCRDDEQLDDVNDDFRISEPEERVLLCYLAVIHSPKVITH